MGVYGPNMEWFYVYVDAINGDDKFGDGSQNKPFKSLKKACDSIPIGGAGTIFLYGSYDPNNPCIYELTDHVRLVNKNILMVAMEDSSGKHFVSIKPGAFVIGSYNNAYLILLQNSCLTIVNDPNYYGHIFIENPSKADNNLPWGPWWRSAIRIVGHSAIRWRGSDSYPEVKIYDRGSYIIHSYDETAHQSVLLFRFKIAIENTNVRFAKITTMSMPITDTDVVIEDFNGTALNLDIKDLMDGIVYDTNNIPRNIVSNHIF